MPYHLDCDEDVCSGITRIIEEQNLKAGRALTQHEDHRKGIHKARKCCKRIRAALRLIRPHLDSAFDHENAHYRDIARGIAPMRDAVAAVETIAALKEAFPKTSVDLDALHHVFAERLRRQDDPEARETRETEALAALDAGRDRLPDLVPAGLTLDDLRPGLQRVYAKGRERLNRVREQANAHTCHEWRKSVKYLVNMSRVLQARLAAITPDYIERLQALATHLGNEHDLAELKRQLRPLSRKDAELSHVNGAFALINHRRRRLQRRALALGDELFGADVDDFVQACFARPPATYCDPAEADAHDNAAAAAAALMQPV